MVGPTGIGKSQTAFDVALQLGGEIVVADSRQVYEMIARNASRLSFTTDIGEVLDRARLLFCCVDTPPSYSGDADLSRVETVVREIEYTEPAVRGDTSGKVLKPARIKTGFEVQVPLFCATGDKIEIDTRTGEYRSRTKG